MYYFLKEDYHALRGKIAEIENRMKGISGDMARMSEEGADAFHDNAGHEMATEGLRGWSSNIRVMIDIKNNAKIIEPTDKNDRVRFGNYVTYQEVGQEQEFRRRIGSYMVFVDEDSTISYNSPLAILLLDAEIGDIREGMIGGVKKQFEILDIE